MRNRAEFSSLVALISACWGAASADAQEEGDSAEGFSPTVDFSGFVDTSVFWPIDGTSSDGDVVISLDQVELDVVAVPTQGLTLRTDLNFFPSAGVALDDRLLEQGFLRYHFNGGDDGLFFIAGKLNAPIGAEAIDPTDLYQFSYGQLFTYATPSNLTGFFGGYDTGTILVMLWATNDWDAPPTPDQYLFGGRVQWTGSGGALGLSSTYGPVGVGQVSQLMLDVDFNWAIDALTILAEANYGMSEEEDENGDALTSIGGLVTLNYGFTDALSATLRYDYLKREYGTEVEAHSITGAFLFAVADNFGGIIELRADVPAGDAPAGEPEEDTALTAALELTAFF